MRARWTTILLLSWAICPAACSNDSGDGDADATGGEGGGKGDETCASGCSIDGVCYAKGSTPDDNPCVHCDPSASASEWTDNDGASCSDGLFCTVNDVCSAGVCGGTARDCSDGVDCTGEETCDENEDRCVAGTTTCGDSTLCEAATDTCVSTCTNGCIIDSVCYGDGQENPLNPCQKCDASAAGDTAWADNDGVACDDGVFCNGEDTCSAGACVSSGDPCTEAGKDCLEEEDFCCTPGVAVESSCNADGDAIGLDDCGSTFLVDDCLDAASNGACYDGICGCAAGFAGDDCDECRFFVSADGDDANLGNSWLLALATVQAGLDAAAARVESGDFTACEVWVAAGTYVPTSGSGREKTIALEPNVALYGGFAGTESLLTERDIAANATILSGDLDLDGNTSDNAYHVVTGADFATIDGFTITAGNANGSQPHNYGGGMYNDDSSPTVSNCTFSGNSAHHGGGMFNTETSPTISNCTFSGNSANWGGGMCNDYSSPIVSNCTFSGNSANSGGGMFNYESNAVVSNSVFWGDTATSSGPEIAGTLSSPTVTYSIVEGGHTGTGNLDVDPRFVSATDLHLQAGSPAIDAADGCSAPLTDIEGNGRVDIANVANTGVGPAADIGAHEYQGGSEDSAAAAPSVAVCCTVDADATLAHDYYYCPTSKTWADAEDFCQASEMHLASIGDSEENAVVETLLVAADAYIGANDIDVEGTWTWSSGEVWDPNATNWMSDAPTGEDCVILYASGEWNDVACAKLFPFVCETTD